MSLDGVYLIFTAPLKLIEWHILSANVLFGLIHAWCGRSEEHHLLLTQTPPTHRSLAFSTDVDVQIPYIYRNEHSIYCPFHHHHHWIDACVWWCTVARKSYQCLNDFSFLTLTSPTCFVELFHSFVHSFVRPLVCRHTTSSLDHGQCMKFIRFCSVFKDRIGLLNG